MNICHHESVTSLKSSRRTGSRLNEIAEPFETTKSRDCDRLNSLFRIYHTSAFLPRSPLKVHTSSIRLVFIMIHYSSNPKLDRQTFVPLNTRPTTWPFPVLAKQYPRQFGHCFRHPSAADAQHALLVAASAAVFAYWDRHHGCCDSPSRHPIRCPVFAGFQHHHHYHERHHGWLVMMPRARRRRSRRPLPEPCQWPVRSHYPDHPPRD
jgi:hypothetical protein